MTIYCGVDFHARQQTVCYCETTGGAVQLAELDHQADDVRGFYSAFTREVVVGIEASGYSAWFVELVEGLGHEVLRLLRYRHKLVRMRTRAKNSLRALAFSAGCAVAATEPGRARAVPPAGDE